MKILEKNEKDLRGFLHEKSLLFESEKNAIKRNLAWEKTKNERMGLFVSEIKEEYTRKSAFLLKESIEKDQKIKRIMKKNQKELQTKKNSVSLEKTAKNKENVKKIEEKESFSQDLLQTEAFTQRNCEITDEKTKKRTKSFSAYNPRKKSVLIEILKN